MNKTSYYIIDYYSAPQRIKRRQQLNKKALKKSPAIRPFARNPQKYRFGVIMSDDAPAPIGGFYVPPMWFDSRREMILFLAKKLDSNGYGFTKKDTNRVELLRKRIITLADKTPHWPALIQKLNRLLAHIAQIEWVGSFDDLCNGRNTLAEKTASEIVKAFCEVKKINVRTIPDEMRKEFTGFLREWGM
jgi:hypothetical protein